MGMYVYLRITLPSQSKRRGSNPTFHEDYRDFVTAYADENGASEIHGGHYHMVQPAPVCNISYLLVAPITQDICILSVSSIYIEYIYIYMYMYI